MKKAKVICVHKNCDTGCVFTESGVKLEQFSGWVTGDGRGSTRGLAVAEGCPTLITCCSTLQQETCLV